MASDRVRSEWAAIGATYRRSISSGASSSAWLRDTLLKPAVIRLLCAQTSERVLDVGTGGGWLFDEIKVEDAHACDVTPPDIIPDGVTFANADAADLPYLADDFDAIVASVVLCYCADLAAVAAEFARVTRVGGRAVIALVHPYFYRTGVAEADGSYRITRDLAFPASFDIEIGGRVGPFTYHYHRPEGYINAFIEAGWSLERMEDAFIPQQQYAARFAERSDEIRRSANVPLFTFFRFVKRAVA